MLRVKRNSAKENTHCRALVTIKGVNIVTTYFLRTGSIVMLGGKRRNFGRKLLLPGPGNEKATNCATSYKVKRKHGNSAEKKGIFPKKISYFVALYTKSRAVF